MATNKHSTEAGEEKASAGPAAEAAAVQPPDSPQKQRTVLDVIRSRQFLFGLAGWYAVNGILWWLASDPTLVCATFPLNLMLLLGLALGKTTKMAALGMLTAIALNAAIALTLQLAFNATCFVPFFIRGQELQF